MRSILFVAIAGLSILVAACSDRATTAYGDANSIIVVTPDSVWGEVEDTVNSVLEPRIFTVRNERTFEVTQVSPQDTSWLKLRLFKQLLVIGRATDPWMTAVLADRKGALPALPAVIEQSDVWARGQRVTALVLPPGDGEEELVETLPALHELFDKRFRAYVYRRMFVSGRDEALRDTLRAEAGFSLLLPVVYTWKQADDSVYIFRNDNMTGGELERMVVVARRSGTPEQLTPELALEWRDRVAEPQATSRDTVLSRPLEGFGARALEVQGVWTGRDPSFPTAGPYISRVVVCPEQDRMYLVDASLYAPGKRKYEYMLQLETILDSFACAG